MPLKKPKQDGRLAPAYFSPNYKYFIQLLQTVKDRTTVLILVFKEFLQTSIPPLISVTSAKRYHDFPLENFCLTVPKNFEEEPFCVSENFWYRKTLGIREAAGITIFRQNCFVSQYQNISKRNPSVFQKILVSKNVGDKRRRVSRISAKLVLSHSVKTFRRGTLQKVSGIEKFYA